MLLTEAMVRSVNGDFPDGNARFEVQMGLVEAKKKKLLDLLELVCW